MANTPQYPDTPMGRMMAAGGLRWCEVAARSGVSELTVRRMSRATGLGVGSLLTLGRVAVAMGCAPAEILPALARRPRTGLLYERSVFHLPKSGSRRIPPIRSRVEPTSELEPD